MVRAYEGPDRRRGSSSKCEDCTVNTTDLALLKNNHDSVIKNMGELTSALKDTNQTLNQVVIQLAEARGARKAGLMIASLIGSACGFLGEMFFHKIGG